jgi:cysteine desulfurase
MSIFTRKAIYLDHASATPLRKEVISAMKGYYSREFYNPSSIYDEGRKVKDALESARTRIARVLHAGAKDIVFTSGGTESDNLAILGSYEYAKDKIDRPHIIVTKHEHPAILEAAHEAERKGAELSIVERNEIKDAIRENTVLISVSLVQGETGEVIRAKDIGRKVREIRRENESEFPYLHLDASQAVLTEDLNVDTLHADLLTLDAAKIYGPKGSGVLVVRPWVKLRPLLWGGGQERGLRSGTENVSACLGLAEALMLANLEKEANRKHFETLRRAFVELVQYEIPTAIINGEGNVAPHIVSVTLPGKLHEFVAVQLAERRVLVSTGSSCSSEKDEEDKEAIRFSFGIDTTLKEVRDAARILKEILL